MVIAAVAENGAALARILAIDQGEGIANIAEAMSDGFSTAGTMGGGLGAMKRLATKLDIFTGRGRTIVLLELGTSAPKLPLQISGFAVPYPGERVCGDAWSSHQTRQRIVALLADGLGHGWGLQRQSQRRLPHSVTVWSWRPVRFSATCTMHSAKPAAWSQPSLRFVRQREC